MSADLGIAAKGIDLASKMAGDYNPPLQIQNLNILIQQIEQLQSERDDN
jgi:hypothetical protein